MNRVITIYPSRPPLAGTRGEVLRRLMLRVALLLITVIANVFLLVTVWLIHVASRQELVGASLLAGIGALLVAGRSSSRTASGGTLSNRALLPGVFVAIGLALLLTALIGMNSMRSRSIPALRPPRVHRTVPPPLTTLRDITCDLSSLSPAEQWIILKNSGGNPTAKNPRSTAFGLGQLLLGNRKHYLGANFATTDCKLQIQNFRGYIRDRYGDAKNAKAFHEKNGWY